MKQKDIILIIVCIFISGVISIVLSNMFISSSANRQVLVEVIEPISADFSTPDPRFFNEKSINPTQVIQIGDPNTNAQPTFSQ